jgi:hypothetical protein
MYMSIHETGQYIRLANPFGAKAVNLRHPAMIEMDGAIIN